MSLSGWGACFDYGGLRLGTHPDRLCESGFGRSLRSGQQCHFGGPPGGEALFIRLVTATKKGQTDGAATSLSHARPLGGLVGRAHG